jgi:Helix-turn-helix domain
VSRPLICAAGHSPAKRSAKLLLVQLAEHAHPDGTGVWASQKKLADETGLSRATVQRAQTELVALSLIHVKVNAGKNGVNLYSIRLCMECIDHEQLAKDRHAASCITVRHEGAAEQDGQQDEAQEAGGLTMRQGVPYHEARTSPRTAPTVRPSAKAGAGKPVGLPATSVATAPPPRPDAGEDVAATWWKRWDGGEEFDSREDEDQQKRDRAVLLLAWDARASPDPVDNGSLQRTEVRVIGELDTWEAAPLPAEPLDEAEPEPVTVVRTVGVDAVLVPLAVALAEEKRRRRRERGRRTAAA